MNSLVSSVIGQDLDRAARLLRTGRLVAFGTETVYGLGADATNAEAVSRVFTAKNRPQFDPLIVHVPTVDAARSVAADWPKAADQLAKAFWPGPLTLVLPKRPIIVDLVTSGLLSVGIRVPGHSPTLELLGAVELPIAAPSANPFGMVSPTTAMHVQDQLGAKIDYIFDTGPCTVGVESTVVRIEQDRVTLLRPGGVTLEQLRTVVTNIVVGADQDKAEMHSPDSPGQLPQHYSPGVRLRLGRPTNSTPRDGLMVFGKPCDDWQGPIERLSSSGDVVEAAKNLFGAMRRLAAHNVQTIFVDDIPEVGLGVAINDRLRRAVES